MTSSPREVPVEMTAPAGSIYAFSSSLLDGRTASLSQFAGRVLLIVNTASRCGFTPQYAALEQLYRAYRDRGFTVLAFPCNQFGRQEPGTSEEIGAFCREKFGVSFPVFAPIGVNGSQAHPLYRFLKDARPGFLGMRRISWNFTKFLIDRQGKVVRRYPPAADPATLAPAIENLLA
jgi:glutathione peroxidase